VSWQQTDFRSLSLFTTRRKNVEAVLQETRRTNPYGKIFAGETMEAAIIRCFFFFGKDGNILPCHPEKHLAMAVAMFKN
jgi:hypothetical protein